MLGLILKQSITSKILLTQVRFIHGITQKYFTRDKSIFSAKVTVRMFLMRCARLSDGVTQPTSFLKSNGLLQNLSIQRQMSQLDVNMNVQNNVILYKYEKDTYFRNIKIFGIGQMVGWLILAYYAYKPSFWDIFTTDIKLKEYWYNHMFRLTLFLFSIFSGPLMLLCVYAMCARSIKYLILNKGGKTFSIFTYHMQKKKSSMKLPVEMVRCTRGRISLGGCIPVKIKNKSFYYLIDKQGTFLNPKLFDHTTS